MNTVGWNDCICCWPDIFEMPIQSFQNTVEHLLIFKLRLLYVDTREGIQNNKERILISNCA